MTLSLNLPLPVANGAGTAVDVSTLGAPLTLTCVGQLAGANIAIEVSNDGGTTWQPMIAWQNVGGERVIPVAIQWMRTNVSGRGTKPWLTFSADLDVAGPGTGTTVVSLPMPVGNGAGAAVDTSALEQLCTFVCTGSFAGCSIAVEISEDNVGWTPLVAFSGIGGVISKVVNASWMRVNVSGRTSAPFSGLMAVGSSALGSATAGIVVEDEGVPVVTTTTINFVGAGVTVTDVAGVATVTIAGGSSVFVWHVGTTWDVIYAQMAAVSGPKICLVEFDPSGSRTMTARAGDPTDLNQVLFIGSQCISRQDGDGITIVVDDGFKLADMPSDFGLRCTMQSQWLSWDFQALTSAAYTTANVATDLATWTQLGGQLKGSLAAEVFRGSVAVSLVNVVYKFGCLARATSEAGTIEASARSEFFWPIFDTDGGGHALSIFTDASCAWAPSGFTGGGFTITGSVEVHNFARGPDGNSLYAISVDGGGAVIATLVP